MANRLLRARQARTWCWGPWSLGIPIPQSPAKGPQEQGWEKALGSCRGTGGSAAMMEKWVLCPALCSACCWPRAGGNHSHCWLSVKMLMGLPRVCLKWGFTVVVRANVSDQCNIPSQNEKVNETDCHKGGM